MLHCRKSSNLLLFCTTNLPLRGVSQTLIVQRKKGLHEPYMEPTYHIHLSCPIAEPKGSIKTDAPSDVKTETRAPNVMPYLQWGELWPLNAPRIPITTQKKIRARNQHRISKRHIRRIFGSRAPLPVFFLWNLLEM